MQTVVGYLEHKRICGMVDVQTYVRTYAQLNCSTIHASVGLAQARPNNDVMLTVGTIETVMGVGVVVRLRSLSPDVVHDLVFPFSRDVGV